MDKIDYTTQDLITIVENGLLVDITPEVEELIIEKLKKVQLLEDFLTKVVL